MHTHLRPEKFSIDHKRHKPSIFVLRKKLKEKMKHMRVFVKDYLLKISDGFIDYTASN
jgi:hypothetical protein